MHYDKFTVSVIIPAFNAETYVGEAIGSVLQQTLPATEIIVVDDGSTDRTRQIVEQHRGLRYIYQENAGVAAALNHGCRLASSEHIAFISADDVWQPKKLEMQNARLIERPNALIFGHMLNFISPDVAPDAAASISCPSDPMPAFSAGTLLTSLETFRKFGSFNEGLKVGEFIDWYGRAIDLQVDVLMLEEIVSLRRVHKSNHSKAVMQGGKSYAPALKAILDRRRAMERSE